MIDLSALRALSERATPGPWAINLRHAPWICSVGNNGDDPAVFGHPVPDGQRYQFGEKDADAALIVAAVNLVRSMLSEEGLEWMARAYYEAMAGRVPMVTRWATWDECCQIEGWKAERIAAMSAALASLVGGL